MKIIPILKAGLSLLSQIENIDWKNVYPVEVHNSEVIGYIPKDKEYLILDANVTSGRTIDIVKNHIKSIYSNSEIKVYGTAKSKIALNSIDILLAQDCTLLDKYLIAVVGKAGSGKGFISRLLEAQGSVSRYKWANYLPGDPGKYGEQIKDDDDPYLVAKSFMDGSEILSDPNRVVVIDGIKSIEQLNFVAYITRRPAFVVWCEWENESKRLECIRLRGDKDDIFDEKRCLLFEKGIGKLKKYAMFKVGLDNYEGLKELYALFDFKGSGVTVWQPWPSKNWILQWLELAVLGDIKQSKKSSKHTLINVQTSGSYAKKLKNLGVIDQKILEHIETIRKGFMVLDDILDEDEIRNNEKSAWSHWGLFQAANSGIAYLAKSRLQARELGIEERFQDMIGDVISGVRSEIDLEEGEAKERSLRCWFIQANKESAFRAYIWFIGGKSEIVGYLDGLFAQVLDDLLGENKEGREGKERLLGRLLIQELLPNVTEEKIREARSMDRINHISSYWKADSYFLDSLKK